MRYICNRLPDQFRKMSIQILINWSLSSPSFASNRREGPPAVGGSSSSFDGGSSINSRTAVRASFPKVG